MVGRVEDPMAFWAWFGNEGYSLLGLLEANLNYNTLKCVIKFWHQNVRFILYIVHLLFAEFKSFVSSSCFDMEKYTWINGDLKDWMTFLALLCNTSNGLWFKHFATNFLAYGGWNSSMGNWFWYWNSVVLQKRRQRISVEVNVPPW